MNEQNIPILNEINKSGYIAQDWLKSIFVPIPRITSKTNLNILTDCLMSHVLELLLKIIHNRIYRKCEMDLEDS